MQTSNVVKEIAANLNIDLCRITDAEELKEAKKNLKARSKTKFWPQPFTNQNLEELTKPTLHFADLKSIIVVAVNYANIGGSKFLSNYVTINDYHNYLEVKLKKLANQLKQKLKKDFNYKIFVDKAPFLEKALAQKAGIGFIGKNTLLINPEFGSNLFLGEIFTDLKIEKDIPLNIDCDNCSLCLEQCKTNALKKAYFLAAEKCTAYLTQKKGILSEQEIKAIGSHIWGCDDCKDICPYNLNNPKSKSKKLKFFNKDLKYFLNLNRKNIPIELKNTAMSWRGSRILVRNAIIAAANLRAKSCFELIEQKLSDNSPIIRYYAAYALAKINYKRAVPKIKKQLKIENEYKYKKKIRELVELEEE